MFLREKTRTKDGKTHRYWSVVENRRVSGRKVVQRQILYLGELNDNQRAGWVRTIEAVSGEESRAKQLALFPDDREELPILDCETIRVRLDKIALRHPRQWGACWLGLYVWDMLELDAFWRERLPSSRKGTSWLNMLKALTCYRLIDPGSEFRFHREWYVRSALGDLLGEDYSLAQKDKPYRCLDLLLRHRDEVFVFLKGQWGKLFGAKYDVLLYDLTSTYFESDPPSGDLDSKKRFGYSRDKRSDCVQVVVALVLTPEGFPMAYEVYPGNTRDTATLGEFLDRREKRYGKFRRTWLMDRGIPTEDILEKMRLRGIDYLVGTPKGHLTRVEKSLLEQTWIQARESVRVKILQQESEFYVYVESHDRGVKERSIRRRRLKRLWASLHELRNRKSITRDNLLMHIGALKKEAGRDFGLVRISLPKPQEPVNENTFHFSLDRERLRRTLRREGRYLLRSNMQAASPETIWETYLLLTRIEQAFKDLKGSLSLRPIWHQLERRIEAHIFVSFLAFCLHTMLRNLARGRAAGLTSEAILEKLSTIQMIDVHLPTTDGRHIVMSRYSQPDKDISLLLA
ncbi:MAG: IS1634 family transposase [Candidatus Jettenia sp.]|nr:MAG: IS1634 family transposase [Candidatus Jettenia sp.]